MTKRLAANGCTVVDVDILPAAASREVFFAAAVGITGVDFLIAEPGSAVFLAKPSDP